LLGERHHQPRRRELCGELTAGLDGAAALELAAGEIAALVGDLRVLPQRAGDQLRQRHRLGVRPQHVHRSLGVVERVGVQQHRRRPEDEAADREPAGVVTVQPQCEHLPRAARRIGGLLAGDHVRRHQHQSLSRRAPGRARGLGGDQLRRAGMGVEIGTADERELDEQLQPRIAVGGREVGEHRAQHGDRVGASAVERQVPGRQTRRVDPQREIPRASCDAFEHARAVVRAGLEQRPRALEVDGVGDIRRRRLVRGALEEPRRGRRGTETPRRLGGTPQGRHTRAATTRTSGSSRARRAASRKRRRVRPSAH
jgi:hypothetical protein